MNNPFKELAGLMESQARIHSEASMAAVALELGTITGSGLKLDSFKHEIRDYYVADWTGGLRLSSFSLIGTATAPIDALGNNTAGSTTSTRTRYDYEPVGENKALACELKTAFKPGDRVLCCPLHGGHDVIVLCKVVK